MVNLANSAPRACDLASKILALLVCSSEGTHEGGRPALPVRPEEAASRGAGGGAEGAQGPAGLPLPEPLSLPQENQRTSPFRGGIKLLMHYSNSSQFIRRRGDDRRAGKARLDGSLKNV